MGLSLSIERFFDDNDFGIIKIISPNQLILIFTIVSLILWYILKVFIKLACILIAVILGLALFPFIYFIYINHPNNTDELTSLKMTSQDSNQFVNLPQSIAKLQEELKNNPLDPNSFARADQAKVEHLQLDLTIDFENHIIDGNVVFSARKIASKAQYLQLDTIDLTIFGVYQLINGSKETIPFKLYPPVPQFGSKLEIDIHAIDSEKFQIQIDYRTNSTSRALMWMKPEQTKGKRHPFMYSQCQAINARSLLPCQDTPSVKATYSAEIRAPKELQVLMSAQITEDPKTIDDNFRKHFFNQKVPIASYLIAIAAGDLVSKKIGRISHVWAEPGTIESAAWEFAEIDKLLDAAEHFAGEYVWGVYDVLVLPPSFPYGGMENPCLTFATPTLLAGDRSLVYVIAHEISHSWTGNLVTNANYEHFWLNEGFTRFLENKIGGRLDKHGEQFRQFTALEGLEDLKSAIQYYGESSPYTKLLIDIHGINPDDVFSSVPYEKGHTLLFYLEQKLGGPQVFEPFLKAYIDKFKYQSIVTDDFRQFLYDYFKSDSKKIETLESIDWNRWFHSPGMPPIIPDYDKTLLMACVNLATKWLKADLNEIDANHFPLAEFQHLHSIQQKLFFVQIQNRLNESTTTTTMSEKLSKMSELYELATMNNCEVKHKWIMCSIKARYDDIIIEAIDFVTKYGRMKYIVPLYRSLYQWEKTRQLALDTFQKNRPNLMRVAIDAIEKDLYPSMKKSNQL
ncbi:Leukotriene A-4 hydrolase [Dermatophagoides farinae]|uniref:Leukotriene A-4 hydrolase n=1 Tax=Dermatophagoides farinae TaxID=6954 RepID=A0A922L4A4_DERFA|nr:leukotriene A-4 hydrolase-like isoform X1 [Dermatophagoides farinae]KAH9511255.1 Leukotriene A-4 hydrolase [Dermatophagoides farinae]